jgi:RNA polymerase sigma-70 factor (ECF subfamily)
MELLGAWCVKQKQMTVAGEDDAALIRAAQDDPASFGVLFDRHFDAIYRFCGRRVEHDLAEDLAGETFRRAFEARHSYDLSKANALPWLFRIALNLVRDAIRARAVEDRAHARLRALAGTQWSSQVDQAARIAEARHDLAVLARLLVAEPREDVDALFLHVWEGLSYSDVASTLGIPVGTVRSRLSRLRRRLDDGLHHQPHPSRTSHLEEVE